MFDTGKDLVGACPARLPPDGYPPGNVSFPIVGIGASAGGLEAFIGVLEHLSTATGMAYVFVQHLDPSHSSLLPDLLARVTKMPLYTAQDHMKVEPDHVYVIPPNADMTLEQGILHLAPRAQTRGPHFAIDLFFRSLAQDRHHQAIGVLLSGTASDGTEGLEAIKAQGGMTFAQDEQSAAYPQMPQHAIASGCVDQILPPEGIASALMTLSSTPHLTPFSPLETHMLIPSEQQAFTQIRLLLRKTTGIDFRIYRPATIQRRIARRMAITQIDKLSAYATYLDTHPAEVEALSREALIHVTSFFRDESAFKALELLVFPKLIQHLVSGDPLRIWIVGCSTGEEVYSLAISLLEFLKERGLTHPIQIFATDIDTTVLKQARTGIYAAKSLQAVSPQRLEQFFLPMDRKGDRYQVSKAIREQCVFARQNITSDPPFSRLDLVSCRNLLIYLTLATQERVLQALHYALKPHGFLLLGTSESVGLGSTFFARVEPNQKLFIRKSRNLVLSTATYGDGSASSIRGENMYKRDDEKMNEVTVQQEADRLLLTTYVPASVVIDADMQILHIRGHISPYLEPAPGKANFHLLKWAREGLKLGLRATIHAAQKQDRLMSREGLQVSGTNRIVRITVVPLKEAAQARSFLVLFEEALPQTIADPPLPDSQSGQRDAQSAAATRIAVLEQELAANQTEVQAILEEHDGVNERLQETNEEIKSSNEELQSINEELETSKAELQAINEELTTANQQLQILNEQLRASQDYAESIIETIREPLVVLSADFRLQRANTAFYQFYKVTPSQVEQRSLFELGNGQWDRPQLRELLEQVQVTNQSFHDVEVEHRFPSIGHKVMRLAGRRVVHEREGTRNHLILLVMEDITARREMERQKEALLGIVSHELITPISGAKLAVQFLQRRAQKVGDEQTATGLGKVDVQLDKLSHLIGSLLDATALQTGTLSMHLEPFAIGELIQTIVEEFGSSRLLMEEVVQAQAYGDRERTGQVIRNLLTNALKYSSPPALVRVGASANEAMITLHVQDSGVGIPQDQQARIFERFARVDQPEQGKVSGVGLGLYIAAQIVTQQGGQIWVESASGKGTTFFFDLPRTPLSAVA